jgi:nitrate/TMAO reductase-like tetraheme cytochrome c subunit
MSKLGKKIRNFFFTPSDATTWIRLAPFVVLGILTLVIATGSVAVWNYTNSNSFCGTTCHTMPPQYSAYLRSPHARVDCVECHLGRGTLDVQLPRKIAHSDTLYALIFHTYEYPIVAKKMRPANEACETCHFPQKFSNDSLVEIKNFAQDATNSVTSTFLAMKIGGGTKRQGLGLGIHWHIENNVTFLATDELQQNIPYVRVEDENGKVTEYYDITAPEQVTGKKLQNMDCITCHNRVTHTISSPEVAVGEAISKGLISSDLPYINQQAVALLKGSYTDQTAAFAAFDGLKTYYSKNYIRIYSDKPELIDTAIAEVKSIYTQIKFPEQGLDWNSHPDNLGHKDSAGCFRCHDGKHFTADGKAIRMECNLCHSIPQTSDPAKFITSLPLERGPEPTTHTNTSWIALHGKVIDASCAGCHAPKDASIDYTKLQGKPPVDGSFCGNSACHTNVWKYAGFDSPALSATLADQIKAMAAVVPTPAPSGTAQTYENTVKAMLNSRCGSCHTGSTAMNGMDLSSYASIEKGSKDGAGVTPGDLANSLIYKVQNAGGHFGQLAQAELDTLKAWILAGAPEK